MPEERQHLAGELDEDHALGRLRRLPAERGVEGPRPVEIRHAERDSVIAFGNIGPP